MTTILVVDDEVDLEALILSRFRRKIQQQQYNFLFAHNGLEAIALLRANDSIDIVLTDINMPEMDGLTLLTELSALNPMLRAVMVSAYGDLDNIRTAMNRGAFDFVMKPINFKDLELTIDKTALHVGQLRESQQLKVIDELKTRFFDNITHEFRTPLTLILAPVEQILNTPHEPGMLKRHLLTVERNARHLLRLINQLLDLAKLESGQLTLMPIPGNLGEFVGDIIAEFSAVAQARGLSLNYTHDLPNEYAFDADRMEQIVYNLVANALKFTPTGSVTITLGADLQTTPGQPTLVQLTVADTGIGIAAEKLPYIFNRFYQAGSQPGDYRLAGPGQMEPGTGIGLALVSELTELMGGTVKVHSSVKTSSSARSGTTFTVSIPLLQAAAGTSPVRSAPRPGYTHPEAGSPAVEESPFAANRVPADDFEEQTTDDPVRPTVLVVEDHDELRMFVAEDLATHYQVLTAINGADAWEIVQDQLPDVVISDVMMPVMDGFELTRLLKSTPATNHVAVVLLTAKAAYQNRIEGLTLGADDYLAKPFHAEELHLRVRNLLDRQQKLRTHHREELARPDGAKLAETVADKFLRQVYATIELHLSDSSLSMDVLAKALAVSRKTLYRKLHSVTQLSPNEIVRQYRLRKGADLLRAGYNVSETAYLVGFDSATYFGKCFKEAYGIAPSEMQSRSGEHK